MAFDGNGNFNRLFSWVSDKNNGINITASRVDSEDNGFASGLSICVTRDGQGKMTADFLPSADASYNLDTGGARWKNITISGSITAGSVVSAGTITANSGKDATPDSGSWTTTLSGPWVAGSNPTGTLKWERQGSLVTVWCDTQISQTATVSTILTASALPTSITPTSNRDVVVTQLFDNGSGGVCGDALVLTTGNIQFSMLGLSGSRILRGTSFTGSGVTGLGATLSFSYSL
jgi:hypothetical protein